MLKYLFSFFIFLSLPSWSYAEQATPSTEDVYISLALTNDVSKLKGSGPRVCKYDQLVNTYGKDPAYESKGKTLEEAQLRLALLCIKERCKQVGQWILGALGDFDQVNESDKIDYLNSQSYSDSEISTILKNQKEQDRTNIKSITCETGTPTARFVIVTSCTGARMRCPD